jgi:ParB-like chromosome segregation protein Spo0J
MEVKISEIIVEDRVRQSNGWLDSLERSIEHYGVLQPIGITKDKKLIFGARRLQASKNIGKETIPARIFDIEADNVIDALRLEREENEHRKDLTPSEKVAIAMKIEELLAGRQGSNQYQQKVEVQNFAQAEPNTKTIDIAAKAVDMNRETYRQAKAVVSSGNEQAVKAMDSGEKSINAAYNSVRKTSRPRTFSITLYKNPKDDAEVLLIKAGAEYCTKLALEILKAAGHDVKEAPNV